MKKAILFLLLLSGCVLATNRPEPHINCYGNFCCHPIDNRLMMCASSDPYSKNIIIYVKIIER
jgi:hypothetical protein